ncbi:FKBP-type peptidyl-prolyl cis-trans isomerase [Streptomyces natalensis]|uniref:peptidylprolyl isomerase n=1 Tax=Streptomyces natalensis ATCC 27448 TaxID=1240678 RepID=A0A0D7CNB2_9ACTN|nr:FKBP-type peptidyl-prolyl cis-trans isomerase [Streptomyces natalensis]KIZ17683.1 peptidylprolyl isomerase [Streptomyces natalensis ATCC 27448]
MNLTKNTRRAAAAALTVPIMLFAAACGSDDGKAASSGEPVAKVTGKAGAQPKITAPKNAKVADAVVTKSLVTGKGAAVKKGDVVRLDVVAQTLKGQRLDNTWEPVPGQKTVGSAHRQVVAEVTDQLTQPTMPPKVLNALAGKKVGSRVEVEASAKAAYGADIAQRIGLQPDEGLVWVVDVAAATKVDKKAAAEGKQAASESGMPEVKAEAGKAATITVPKGEKAPTKLGEQVLIKGKGPEVKAGQGLIAQYTGVKWRDGKKFDSSWDHGGATAFQIGTGSVVQGWDKGLVGKHVGDRVVLSIPADLAYGDTPPQNSGLAKGDALIFTVDILGTA